MKPFSITCLFLLLSLIVYGQEKNDFSKLFGFELIENNVPIGWKFSLNKDYVLQIDSTQVYGGKYATSITYSSGEGFGSIFSVLPNYSGKKITVSAFVKTENVTEGYAGLWVRIDPTSSSEKSIAFDNMSNKGIKGTTDWTRYEITLDLNPEKTSNIFIGALLVGKGKMWVDDFAVTIDGKDIAELTPIQQTIAPAKQDKEFDTGSKISSISMDQNNIENLKFLGLIWGFLKYYHPSIAKGNYNWDYELFRVLPKVLKTKNKNERDKLFVEWISALGEVNGNLNSQPVSKNLKSEPDLNWIDDSNLSEELVELLRKIKSSERANEHYYIGMHPSVGNPEFKNEEAYSSMAFPDLGYRLLALYRYWNVIQYFFPYKDLIEEDWKNVLEEFIPKLENTKNETEYALTVLELIGRIHDTHANIWAYNKPINEYFGLYYTPVKTAFIEGQAVVTGFYNENLAKQSGMVLGDIITKVNGVSTENFIKDRLKFTPASNYATQLRDISNNLLRSNDTVISVEFFRDKKIQQAYLNTYSDKDLNIYYQNAPDTSFKLLNSDIAYINNGSLKKSHVKEFWKDLKNTKGLIIDNRNYPSDFPIFELSNYLLPQPTPFVKFTFGSINSAGTFSWSEALHTGKQNDDYYKGKVLILVNEISQSSSEYHAMAYQTHPNASVVGSTTAAADGNISFFYLPGGIRTAISGIGIYYPDGRGTQRIGIVPDIEVKPTIQGIKEGKDEVLEKAIQILNEE
ncbi:S41 family peptidase [Sphingobacterium hungaricum]|uniref:Peptidase S41 n=1 Tax=Sphingobacterium hungaricum TaxID=2082723 RepID=A0A928UY86_9SPHI|nr:S41 family peptidase [Sphingobacterium hungaricum]MBE8714213.1 peptidase S41 [Sphingobacterium hungaricum]